MPTGLTSRAKLSRELSEKPAMQDSCSNNLEKLSSSDDDVSPKDQEDQGWTTIKHKCVHSLSSLPRTKKHSIEGVHTTTYY